MNKKGFEMSMLLKIILALILLLAAGILIAVIWAGDLSDLLKNFLKVIG